MIQLASKVLLEINRTSLMLVRHPRANKLELREAAREKENQIHGRGHREERLESHGSLRVGRQELLRDDDYKSDHLNNRCILLRVSRTKQLYDVW